MHITPRVGFCSILIQMFLLRTEIAFMHNEKETDQLELWLGECLQGQEGESIGF